MNKELLQSAKDEAAREYRFKDWNEFRRCLTDALRHAHDYEDAIIKRAMEIYAERVAVEFADWIAQNCRMYENEFSLYNLNEDVLEIRPISELYELFNLFKTTKP